MWRVSGRHWGAMPIPGGSRSRSSNRTRAGSVAWRDPVHIVDGRQAGAGAAELPHPGTGDGADLRPPISVRKMSAPENRGVKDVPEFAVGCEVILAAQQIVVHPRDARARRVGTGQCGTVVPHGRSPSPPRSCLPVARRHDVHPADNWVAVAGEAAGVSIR